MKFDRLRDSYLARLRAAAPVAQGKFVAKENALALLNAIVRSGDRVCLEGDNQKQADFFARELVKRGGQAQNHCWSRSSICPPRWSPSRSRLIILARPGSA